MKGQMHYVMGDIGELSLSLLDMFHEELKRTR